MLDCNFFILDGQTARVFPKMRRSFGCFERVVSYSKLSNCQQKKYILIFFIFCKSGSKCDRR